MPKRWLCIFVLLLFCATASALQRQPDADYKTRREALGKKVGGIAVLFGSLEPVESLYSFRQDDDFYYRSPAAHSSQGAQYRAPTGTR